MKQSADKAKRLLQHGKVCRSCEFMIVEVEPTAHNAPIAFCNSKSRRLEMGEAIEYILAFPIDGLCKYWQ